MAPMRGSINFPPDLSPWLINYPAAATGFGFPSGFIGEGTPLVCFTALLVCPINILFLNYFLNFFIFQKKFFLPRGKRRLIFQGAASFQDIWGSCPVCWTWIYWKRARLDRPQSQNFLALEKSGNVDLFFGNPLDPPCSWNKMEPPPSRWVGRESSHPLSSWNTQVFLKNLQLPWIRL